MGKFINSSIFNGAMSHKRKKRNWNASSDQPKDDPANNGGTTAGPWRPTRRELLAAGLGLLGLGGFFAYRQSTRATKNEEDPTSEPVLFSDLGIPENYGRVIYQKNPDAPNQLYIISQLHRSSVSRRNVTSTVPRAQLEVYRISEHLIEHNGIELILHEGFNAEKDYSSMFQSMRANARRSGSDPFMEYIAHSDRGLESLFADEGTTLDAVAILVNNYAIDFQGAEDETLYNIQDQRFGRDPRELILALAKVRSAKLLQNAPLVIEREVTAGRIHNKKAIVVIGDAHIDEMMRYLEEDRVMVDGIPQLQIAGIDEPLGLTERNYGASVILPNSVREFMEIHPD